MSLNPERVFMLYRESIRIDYSLRLTIRVIFISIFFVHFTIQIQYLLLYYFSLTYHYLLHFNHLITSLIIINKDF